VETVGAGETHLLSCWDAALGTVGAAARESECDCCSASLAISTCVSYLHTPNTI
jgi:hypothetical protein